MLKNGGSPLKALLEIDNVTKLASEKSDGTLPLNELCEMFNDTFV